MYARRLVSVACVYCLSYGIHTQPYCAVYTHSPGKLEGAGAVFAVTCGGSIGCAVGGAGGGGGGGCDSGGGAGGCASSGGGGGGSVCASAGTASTREKRKTNVFVMADRSFRPEW